MVFIDQRLQPVYIVVLDCPGKDSIRLWPLQAVDPWFEEGTAYPPRKRVAHLWNRMSENILIAEFVGFTYSLRKFYILVQAKERRILLRENKIVVFSEATFTPVPTYTTVRHGDLLIRQHLRRSLICIQRKRRGFVAGMACDWTCLALADPKHK